MHKLNELGANGCNGFSHTSQNFGFCESAELFWCSGHKRPQRKNCNIWPCPTLSNLAVLRFSSSVFWESTTLWSVRDRQQNSQTVEKHQLQSMVMCVYIHMYTYEYMYVNTYMNMYEHTCTYVHTTINVDDQAALHQNKFSPFTSTFTGVVMTKK